MSDTPTTEEPKSDKPVGCPGQHDHGLINFRLDQLTELVQDIKKLLCGNGKEPNVITRLSLVEKSVCSQQWFNRTCGAAIVATLIYAIVELVRA